MKEQISPLIQATELLELCNAEDDLVIVDASTGPDAKSNYEKAHLSGAIFVDLNTQLADIKEDVSHGGRHPLPGIEQFSRSLSNLGITSKSHVVLYDDKNGANAAARLWP